MNIRLPKDRPTRIAASIVVITVGVAVLDFMRIMIFGGFMSAIGLIALVGSGPAMYALAHVLGNRDLPPPPEQRVRNRDRFIKK